MFGAWWSSVALVFGCSRRWAVSVNPRRFPDRWLLHVGLRSAAGVRRLSYSAALDGGQSVLALGSFRTGGYWILAATGLLRPRLSAVSTLRGDGGNVPRLCVCTEVLKALKARRTAGAASVQCSHLCSRLASPCSLFEARTIRSFYVSSSGKSSALRFSL